MQRDPLDSDGWLYNVASGGAVQLTLGDGRRLRVGPDEPEELCRLIAKRATL